MTGDKMWALGGISSIAEQCLVYLFQDSQHCPNVITTLMPNPEIVNRLCINDCYNDHGSCNSDGRNILFYYGLHIITVGPLYVLFHDH